MQNATKSSSLQGLEHERVWDTQTAYEHLRAGEQVMAVYEEGRLELQSKADSSPLTRADIASHQCLAQGLADFGLGCPVVSEEDAVSVSERCDQGHFWLLDPHSL